ncbi:hypothetical protein C5F47_05990 [Nitrosopumilus cobalaminigenes]|uniref:Uncharacterized protein n=1 Tax=Nitrosopumilus cobalaminigenes TaxID=1470066 RepID=A0A7D5M2S1_9ARCH|nr:hypothetical protein [Nitrosopumilus cobalaminigenes]QLH03130.1 hypothetical protein C5F47_05990 [Nitrosopumilus cobalaminigenes]
MKKLSQETITGNLMYVEWFKIEYQPSTRHIKDKQVKKNTMNIRTSHIIHAENLERAIADLKKERLTHIKWTPLTIDLPKKCPDCGKVGNPIIVETKRASDIIKDFKGNVIRKRKPERWLRYNHKDGKHHRIGKYEIITVVPKDKRRTIKQIPSIKLKKSLEYDSLGYRRRVGHYPLPKDFKLQNLS